MSISAQAGTLLDALRARRPLVHCMTNYVTINDCANAALAIGASPIMADDPGEAAEITAHAAALVLNIGKLDPRTLEGMVLAGKEANRLGLPVVFDPVGAGVSTLRGQAVRRIVHEVRLSIVRCNRSEAAWLCGMHGSGSGVDADGAVSPDDGARLARQTARKLGCVTALTGETDFLSDGDRLIRCESGHPMLSRVTGMGCAATVLCAAFAAAADGDCLTAALAGVGAMGVAGEIAYREAGARGTGSFHIAVIDALSRLDGAAFAAALRAQEVHA